MSFTHSLARYSQGRALVRDVDSCKIASGLCASMLEEMMKFDFKNGQLRRKYDGVKYAVKKCENILYELSITMRASGDSEMKDDEAASR